MLALSELQKNPPVVGCESFFFNSLFSVIFWSASFCSQGGCSSKRGCTLTGFGATSATFRVSASAKFVKMLEDIALLLPRHQWQGPLPSSVWTRHRAFKQGQSRGSVATTD